MNTPITLYVYVLVLKKESAWSSGCQLVDSIPNALMNMLITVIAKISPIVPLLILCNQTLLFSFFSVAPIISNNAATIS